MTPRVCPACEGSRDLVFSEEARDPVAGAPFRLYRCGSCALVFADPRETASPEWYAQAAALAETPAPFAPGARDEPWEKTLTVAWRGGAALSDGPVKEYDAVILDGALEHAPEPRELLGRAKRALKRGGRLTVVVPNAARPLFLGREAEDAPPRRVTRWTERALRGLLIAEGFRVAACRAPGPTPRWFAERLRDGALVPAAERAAVRLLFGPDARGDLRSLYAAGAAAASVAPPDGLKGFFAGESRRAAWGRAFRAGCAPIVWPLGAALAAMFVVKKGRGERLVATARLES